MDYFIKEWGLIFNGIMLFLSIILMYWSGIIAGIVISLLIVLFETMFLEREGRYKSLKFISAILLLLALIELPHFYYNSLHFFIFCVSLFLVYKLYKTFPTFVFFLIAIVYNPLKPLYLSKSIWFYIYLITALTFLFSIELNMKHLFLRK